MLNTDRIQQNGSAPMTLDDFDRKILGALTVDATQSYAVLGRTVGLSAPAVFERVRRMRQAGVISATVARLDGAAIGKPLLAFVHVDCEGWGKGPRMTRLNAFPEVEEMHSVAGDTSVIMKVRTASAHALEALLAQIYALPGVKTTRSYIALSTYLDRPIQAGTTTTWPIDPRSEIQAGNASYGDD